MEKERHGFTTFWLFLMLVVNGLAAIFYLFSLELILFILAVVVCVGVILLLKWKIAGFWLIVGSWVVSSFYTIAATSSHITYRGAGPVGGMIIGIITLYLILKMKKYDISTWDYLKGNTPAKNLVNENTEEIINNEFFVYLLRKNNLVFFLSSLYKKCITEGKEEPQEIDLIKKYGDKIYPVVSSWAITAYKGGEISSENRKIILDSIKKELSYYEDIFKKIKPIIKTGLKNEQ